MSTSTPAMHPLLPLGSRIGEALTAAGIPNRVVIGTDATDDDWRFTGALAVIAATFVSVSWRTPGDIRRDFEPMPPGPVQARMTDTHRRMYDAVLGVLLDEGLDAVLSTPNREGDYLVAVAP